MKSASPKRLAHLPDGEGKDANQDELSTLSTRQIEQRIRAAIRAGAPKAMIVVSPAGFVGFSDRPADDADDLDRELRDFEARYADS